MRNVLRSVLMAAALVAVVASSAYAESPGYREMQIHCLTRNIYEEARGESVKAQIVVGLITYARVLDEDFPDHYCRVVYQKGQFSWTDKKLTKKERVDTAAWTIANMIARGIYEGRYGLTGEMRCAKWYKRTDGRGVSKRSMRFFKTRLIPIGAFGAHTAYGLKACVESSRA